MRTSFFLSYFIACHKLVLESWIDNVENHFKSFGCPKCLFEDENQGRSSFDCQANRNDCYFFVLSSCRVKVKTQLTIKSESDPHTHSAEGGKYVLLKGMKWNEFIKITGEIFMFSHSAMKKWRTACVCCLCTLFVASLLLSPRCQMWSATYRVSYPT